MNEDLNELLNRAKELLKDEDHPNASITELLELAKEKRNKEMVLKKAFTE